MRIAVSLLFSEGHANADRYPLGKVWYEAEIATARINQHMASNTALLHAAMVAVVAPKGAGTKHLQKLLKGLQDGN